MLRIKTIIRKEWAEVFKNRLVLFTVLFMPLLFTALPLIILFFTQDAGLSDLSTDMPAQFSAICPAGTTGGECFQIYMVSQFAILFLMMPLIIPINIAAYSIVGEKTTRSLEPLLATPITTSELLAGKNLAAVIPAVLATWLGYALFILGAWVITGSSPIVSAMLNPMWLVAIGLVGPLMSLLSVNFSLMVSSRANDPRTAEQISTVVILPVLLIFLAQISGLFFLNQRIVWIIALATLLLDGVVIYLAVQLFQRETILTRWK